MIGTCKFQTIFSDKVVFGLKKVSALRREGGFLLGETALIWKDGTRWICQAEDVRFQFVPKHSSFSRCF